jgi:hypothetical protein
MRRLISIAAFSLFLAVPVWAQRGGGGHGGGGHMGGGGMHGGFAGGGHMAGGRSFGGTRSAGMRSGSGFSHGFNHSFNGGVSHGSFHNHRFHGNRFQTFGFRNNCFGYSCRNWGYGYPGWGWGWGWGYDPGWSSWDDQDRRFDEDYYRQYQLADEWNQRSLAEQRMRRQQDEAEDDQDAYTPRSPMRRPAPENVGQPQEPVPATVLVFRDQHKEEISNYAIVGQMLMSFSAQRTKRIPLADLDVAATEKANDDRGVNFRVPGTHEGQ